MLEYTLLGYKLLDIEEQLQVLNAQICNGLFVNDGDSSNDIEEARIGIHESIAALQHAIDLEMEHE